jgi:activating signal cointegrator complex subunit 3
MCACACGQVIYVAPLKALVRERMTDWGRKLCPLLGKRMVELTGAARLPCV